MITPTQKKCLDAIKAHQASNDGRSPTFRELKTELGVASTNTVHRTVRQLEDRGKVRRLHRCQRGIQVLRDWHRPRCVELVSYPNARYFTVERIDDNAVLMPMQRAK